MNFVQKHGYVNSRYKISFYGKHSLSAQRLFIHCDNKLELRTIPRAKVRVSKEKSPANTFSLKLDFSQKTTRRMCRQIGRFVYRIKTKQRLKNADKEERFVYIL